MKQGKPGSKNTENELLKELELLREQARKAALLEKENQVLKQQLQEQQQALDATTEKWHKGEKEIEKLKYLLFESNYKLEHFKKRFFGSKSERFVPSYADQLVLELELPALAEGEAPEIIKVEYIRRQACPELNKKPGRMILPDHLVREVVEIHPEGDLTGMVMIGKQVTERLEITPASFKVLQEIRYKYKDTATQKIITPPLPQRAVFKGMAGPALTADILVSKFVDSLPITRQLSRFARMGITLAKSSVNGLIKNNCEFLEPLYDLHIKKVLSSSYLQVDETPVRVLDQSRDGGTRQSYHWVYYSPPDNMVLFDFQQGRDKGAPQKYLKGFKGTLQTDSYAAYYQFDKPGVIMMGCMAHARRKFSDAQDNDPQARIALLEFQQLYAIEHNAKVNNLDAGQLQIERSSKAEPVLQRLRKWAENYLPKLSPSSPMRKAINYFLGNWKKLTAYLSNGETLIDNNPIERSIRPVAIGRKNYLFAGSYEGGCWAAMMYSFFGTCKLHKINPIQWLTDVLTRMPDYPKERLAELLPNSWKPQIAS